MKKVLPFMIIVTLLGAGWIVFRQIANRQAAASAWQTIPLERGALTIAIDANGMVRANQTALLAWKTSGSVEAVNVRLGESVSTGQVLAELKQSSLPQVVILAQADLIQAQRARDDLLNSQTQSSQARLAVEQAQQALENARQPAAAQAEAQRAVAEAQKVVEAAQRALTILETPASESAKEEARAELRLAKNVLDRTLDNIERIERKLRRPESKYMFWESRDLYKTILKNLELKRAGDQRAYENAQNHYDRLLAPPDETNLAVARADLAQAQAQLDAAQRDWERLQSGPNPVDLAVLEARLEDARREWERVEGGPAPQDLSAAEARIAAAQGALNLARLAAPFAGVITAVDSQPGDQIEPGAAAFRLDDLSRLLVDVQIPEVDINRIQVGQPAFLTFDSIPGREFRGKVTSVPRVGDEIEGAVIFDTQVEVLVPAGGDENGGAVRPGMTCTVKIETSRLEDVLLIPNSAVRFAQAQRLVYVLRAGQPVQVQVRLGSSAGDYSPLLEGDLQAGELVILNPPAQPTPQP